MEADRITTFSDLALRYIGCQTAEKAGFSVLIDGAGEMLWERHKDLLDYLHGAERPGLETSFKKYIAEKEEENEGMLQKIKDEEDNDKKVG